MRWEFAENNETQCNAKSMKEMDNDYTQIDELKRCCSRGSR